MPFVLIILGILLVVVGIRNTQGQLGSLIVGDFTGTPNFWYWIAAIFVIGALGYIDELKVPSRAMLALVLITLILSNKGFFAQFTSQLQSGSAQAPPAGPANPSVGGGSTSAAPSSGTQTSSGGVGGALQQVSSAIGPVQGILSGLGL